MVTAKHEGVGNCLRRGDAYGGEVRESKSGGEDLGLTLSVILSSILASTAKVGKESVKFGLSANWEQPA